MGIVSIIVLGFMFVVAVSRIEEAYAERFVAEHRSCCRHA